MSDLGASATGLARYPERDIPISLLKLDEFNFRTDEVDSQRAAIRAVIEEQGNGLVALAEHYLKHGLMPGERLLVIPDDTSDEEDSFIVMEGNRRATMLKILANPALALETNIHNKFSELARTFSMNPQRNLPCVVLPDRTTALIWVEVKHSTGMGGAGVEKWGAPATARFSEYIYGKVTRWIAAIRFLSANGINTTHISNGIARKTTAVSRVLNAGAMRDVLGVHFDLRGNIEFENGDLEAGIRLIQSIMEEMASDRFNTNRVHSFEDRVDFITEFEDLAVKQLAKEHDDSEPSKDSRNSNGNGSGRKDESGRQANDSTGSDPSGRDAGGRKASEGSGRPSQGVRRGSRQRATLASTKRGDELHINVERLNEIYKEARRLKVDNHTSVSAVIIRVFVELSCEHFLVSKQVSVPDIISRRNGGRPTTWHSHCVKFREKIEAAVNYVDNDQSQTAFDEIRRGLGSQDHLHSPENLHDYVHGLETIPSARDLVVIWDRYHPLFAAMFA